MTLQASFEKLENELREVNSNAEALKKNYLELTELKHILRKTQQFFDEVRNKLVINRDGTGIWPGLGPRVSSVGPASGRDGFLMTGPLIIINYYY